MKTGGGAREVFSFRIYKIKCDFIFKVVDRVHLIRKD